MREPNVTKYCGIEGEGFFLNPPEEFAEELDL